MADTYIKKDIVGKADSAAVIDIGSNSIRYAAGRNGKKLVITTRLGSGLAQTGRLDEERMEKKSSRHWILYLHKMMHVKYWESLTNGNST